jgi:hypothetical protein
MQDGFPLPKHETIIGLLVGHALIPREDWRAHDETDVSKQDSACHTDKQVTRDCGEHYCQFTPSNDDRCS